MFIEQDVPKKCILEWGPSRWRGNHHACGVIAFHMEQRNFYDVIDIEEPLSACLNFIITGAGNEH
jgi:hypothetical protein